MEPTNRVGEEIIEGTLRLIWAYRLELLTLAALGGVGYAVGLEAGPVVAAVAVAAFVVLVATIPWTRRFG